MVFTSWRGWLRNGKSSTSSRVRRGPARVRRYHPVVERLEDRRVPAAFTIPSGGLDQFLRDDEARVRQLLSSINNRAHGGDGDLLTLNGAPDSLDLGLLGFAPVTHGFDSFQGQGAAWVDPGRATANVVVPESGHPVILLYQPTPPPGDPNLGTTDANPDFPYTLVGWVYAASFDPDNRPSVDGTSQDSDRIPPGAWFLHEAGYHPTVDAHSPEEIGAFRATPPPGEVPAPSGLGTRPSPQDPTGNLKPRGSLPGVGQPADANPPVIWHPRLWDVHIFLDPNGGTSKIRILDPFGRNLPGNPSPAAAFFYADPESFPGRKYDLVLDMTIQPGGNNGAADTVVLRRSPFQPGEEEVEFLEVVVNGTVLHRDPASLIASVRIVGSGDDETFTLPANLGVPVTIDGGNGNDRLEVVGPNPSTTGVTFRPNSVSRLAGQFEAGGVKFDYDGIDFAPTVHDVAGLAVQGHGTENANYTLDAADPLNGRVFVGNTSVQFFRIELPVTVRDLANVVFMTPNDADSIRITSPASGQNQIEGTSGFRGDSPILFRSLTFFNVRNFTLDLARLDGAANPNDFIVLDDKGLVATGLERFSVSAGAGSDRLTLLAPQLAGTPGFTVRDVKAAGTTINNLTQALALLAADPGKPPHGGERTAVLPVLNFLDAGGGGGTGHFGTDNPFPNDNPATNDDDFVVRATARIFVPRTGPWTFGTNSDDGLRLRLDGADVILDDALHAPQDKLGTVNLTAGFHELELIYFERGGGAELELFAAPGTLATFTGSFRLLGAAQIGDPDVILPFAATFTFDGGPGQDTLVTSADVNFLLSDSLLTTSSGGGVALFGLAGEEVLLTGGNSANRFTVNDWTGTGSLTGGGGLDQVFASSTGGDLSFTLTDTALTRSGSSGPFLLPRMLTLNGISVATLTGGPDFNTFTVSNWSGTAALDGAEGTDSYTVNLRGSGSGRTFITESGATGSDRVRVNGTAAADTLQVSAGLVTRDGEVVTYTGVEQPTVDGGGGDDTLQVAVVPEFTALSINGGPGNDTINVAMPVNLVAPRQNSLSVSGDDGTDTLNVNDPNNLFFFTYEITVMTVTRTFAAPITMFGGLENLVLNAGDASTPINVDQSGDNQNVTVNGQGGNDTVTVRLPSGFFATGQRNIVVNGGDGTDSLDVNDLNNFAAQSFTVTSTTVTRTNVLRPLTYSGLENLLVTAGHANDTVTVTSTNFATPVTVNAGDGNDALTVGGGNLDLLPGRVTVNGNAGTDTITVNDQTAPFSDAYTVTDTAITRIFFGGLTYATVEGLTLNAETGNNAIFVQNTTAATPLTVNAGDGSDTITLGSPAANSPRTLNNLAGAVTVNGGNGSLDRLVLDDRADAVPNSGTVTPTAVTGLGMAAGVTYQGIEALDVFTGSGNDTVSNTVPAGGTPTVTVNLDGGQDGMVFHGTDGDDHIEVSWDFTGADPRCSREDVLAGLCPHMDLVVVTMNGETFVNEYTSGETIFVFAGAGNDEVIMGEAASHFWRAEFFGEEGDDHLVGNTNDDRLDGGPGDDLIEGGPSDDELTGGPGDDALVGGDGHDVLVEAGDVNFTFAEGNLFGLGADTLADIEEVRLTGGPGDNRFTVTPSVTTAVLIDGAGQIRGDTLLVDATALEVVLGVDTVSATGRQPVVFTDVEALVVTPPTPATLADAFVRRLYFEVLERPPDAAGLGFWASHLQTGLPRFEVAQAFWESAEHRGLQVDAYYEQFLHRPADPAGRAAFVAALLAGVSETDVAAWFLTSAEYAAAHLGPLSFLRGLYADVLGRAPEMNDALLLQNFAPLVGNHGALVHAFLFSPEAVARLVDGLFLALLDHPAAGPSQVVLAALFRNQLATPTLLAEALLAADEFFLRAGSVA